MTQPLQDLQGSQLALTILLSERPIDEFDGNGHAAGGLSAPYFAVDTLADALNQLVTGAADGEDVARLREGARRGRGFGVRGAGWRHRRLLEQTLESGEQLGVRLPVAVQRRAVPELVADAELLVQQARQHIAEDC